VHRIDGDDSARVSLLKLLVLGCDICLGIFSLWLQEMMREFLDREKRKQAEREAAKAEKATTEAPAQA